MQNHKNIKSHYNTKKSLSLHTRKFSKIINIRNFNNFIKSILIKKYVNFLKNVDRNKIEQFKNDPTNLIVKNQIAQSECEQSENNHTKNEVKTGSQTIDKSIKKIKVLDLGCGKGGDLKKFLNVGINSYFGIDIAENSIEEAKRRYDEMMTKYFGTNYKTLLYKYENNYENNGIDCMQLFDADFLVQDIYNLPLDLEQKFDLISCQFSLHYAFESKRSFEISIRNISRHLSKNGIFIATIPNKETILRRYRNCGNGFGNQYYTIKFVNGDSVCESENNNEFESHKFDENYKPEKNECDENEENNNKEEKNKCEENNCEEKNKCENKNENKIDNKNDNENDNKIDNKEVKNEDKKESINLDKIFGITYFFLLVEAIDNCIEFLVDTKTLIEEFKKFGVSLVEYSDFLNFFNKNGKLDREMREKMVKEMSIDELKVAELYSVIVFRKD